MSTIDIARGHVLRGGVFDTSASDDVTVNGPGKFAPTAFTDNGNATINAAVIGHGTFTGGIGSNMTFTNSVGAGVKVELNLQATITIDDPSKFHGSLGMAPQTVPPLAPYGEYIDLVGLANATGYTMKNDLLTIIGSNGKPIDKVHLSPSTTYFGTTELPNFIITEDQGSVYLASGYGVYREPGFGTTSGPTLLPNVTHTA
jgi:hypothetical protein